MHVCHCIKSGCYDRRVRHFYSLSLYLLLPVVLLRLWWKGRRVPGYRLHWRERLGWPGVQSTLPVIWIHAVSVGEVRAAQPLVHALQQRYGDMPIVLSMTTPTGRATAQQLFGDSLGYCYLPYDLPGAVQRFLGKINPAVAIIMETEIWPNLYHQLQRRNVPPLLLNARLSTASLRGYLRLRSLSAQAVCAIRHIVVQGEADAQRFVQLGARQEQLSIAGNLKFDVQLPDDFSVRVGELRQCLGGDRPVWVAGSTHAGEEVSVLAAQQRVLQSRDDALLVIAPRHPERAREVADQCEQSGLTYRLFSDIGQYMDCDIQVLVVDTLGELVYLYGVAQVAFIGGSLVDAGGHNPIEAVLAGAPVISGPQRDNFSDVYAALQQAAAARFVDSEVALAEQVCAWLADAALRKTVNEAGRSVLEQNRGALKQSLDLLGSVIE